MINARCPLLLGGVLGKWPARSACQWEQDKVATMVPRSSVRVSMVGGAHRVAVLLIRRCSYDGRRHHSAGRPVMRAPPVSGSVD